MTLCTASLAAAAPALAELDVPESASPYFQDPAFEQAFEAEQERLRQLWQQRTSPQGQQALEDSASAYSDLSAAAAVEVGTDEHPETLAEPTFDPLAGQPASEIEAFAGDFGAIVDVPGEQTDTLVESTLPLQAEAPSGELELVDNDLNVNGAVLEPENPLAGLALPRALGEQAIELPDIDVTVAPEGLSTSPKAEVVAQRAFYANAYTDTDFIAGPVAGGFESFYQLRSANSPESFGLNVDLPEGAELVESGAGAAIVRDGEELAYIAPPSAADNDGIRVPASYDIDGDTLVTRVDHQDEDWAYPILVDPNFTETYLYWNSPGSTVDFTEWTYAENDADFGEGQGGTGEGRGLYTVGGPPWNVPPYNVGGDYYFPYLSVGNWTFNAPGTQSRIYKATFANVLASSPLVGPYSQPFHWVMQGIQKPPGTWENGVTYAGASSPLVLGGNISQYTTLEHCLDTAAPYCRDIAGTNDNSAVLMSFTNPGGYPPSGFHTFMGGASVSIADTILPTMGTLTHTYQDGSGVHPGLPSGWVDSVNLTFRSQARDLGLGIKSFNLSVPNLPLQTRTVTCAGPRTDRCPNTAYYASHTTQLQNPDDYTTGHSFNYSTAEVPGTAPEMPEGIVKPSGWATDALGNLAVKSEWQLKVDRSAPVLNLSGSLKQADDAGGPLTQQTYQLTVNATDGSTALPSQQRSGVKRIEIYVDDIAQIFTPDQLCPAGNCSRATTFEFVSDDYSEGQHTVKVVAEDQLGHRSQQSLTFTTEHQFNPTDNDEPVLNVQIGPPVPPSNNFEVTITGTDVGGSGVEQLVVYVDGQVFQQFDQPCPGGGCSMTRTVSMGPAQSPAQHEIAVAASDRAGNTVLDIQGKATTRPNLFGFSDNFDNRDSPPFDGGDPEPAGELSTGLIKAIEGRADVIRFPIDWCDIASSGIEDQPSTWEWGKFDDIFNQVWAYNTNGTAIDDLDVVAMLVDSPAWAVNNPDSPECGEITEPPAPEHLDDWGMFVRGVLDRWGHPNFGITAVEAWNEPNLPKFWGIPPGTSTESPDYNFPQPDHFASLVNVAFEQVGDYIADWNQDPPTGQPHPNITMMPGGMAAQGYSRYQFLKDALTDSQTVPGQDFINHAAVQGLSVHLYANFAGKNRVAAEKLLGRYEQNVDAVQDSGLPVPPVWITEVGFPSAFVNNLSDKSSSNKTQRQRLLQAYLRYSNPPYDVKAFMVYRLIDEPQPPISQTQLFGVIRQQSQGYTPKPAYCYLANAARIPGETSPPPGCS